jgi:TolA-binding protein
MVDNLRSQVAEREAQVAQLNDRVNTLQTQVTDLTGQVQQGQQTIQEQQASLEDNRREMGTIYYTIGSKKELKDAGLIESKGGVLGLGKTIKPTGQVDDSRFTSIDTDQQTVIQIPSEKARVLTSQPPSSYELQPVNGQLELHITDPKAFRTVKHVIIMTA